MGLVGHSAALSDTDIADQKPLSFWPVFLPEAGSLGTAQVRGHERSPAVSGQEPSPWLALVLLRLAAR